MEKYPSSPAPYDETYQQLYNLTPPDSITFSESFTDIIRPARGFVDEFDLTMQTQVGCPGGCLFCYVPSGNRLTPAALRGEAGEKWGFEVRRKRGVIPRFQRHLREGDLFDKTLYWSGVTDPYATSAAETHQIWEALCEAPDHLRPRRVVVQTRYRPDRDVNLMSFYAADALPSDGGPAVVVSYSIGTDRNDFIRAWERSTPLFERRMETIETLYRGGIWVVPTLSPFGYWNDLEGTLRQFLAWGIPYITCLFFKENTNSANTPGGFINYLRREHPTLLDPAWQRQQLDIIHSVYGEDGVLIGKAGFASLTAPQRAVGGVLESL